MNQKEYNRLKNHHHEGTDTRMDEHFANHDLWGLYWFVLPGSVHKKLEEDMPKGFNEVMELSGITLLDTLSHVDNMLSLGPYGPYGFLHTRLLMYGRDFGTGVQFEERPFHSDTIRDMKYDNYFALTFDMHCMGPITLALAVGYRDKATEEMKALIGLADFGCLQGLQKKIVVKNRIRGEEVVNGYSRKIGLLLKGMG